MDVTPLIPEGRQIIQSYTREGFRVSGKSYNNPVIISLNETEFWEFCGDLDTLDVGDFSQLFARANEIDIILFGTGARARFIQPKLKKNLSDKGLHLEAMDTGAACRTFNVLMAEGRRVVAVLLPHGLDI